MGVLFILAVLMGLPASQGHEKPRKTLRPLVITGGVRDGRNIALTFDDGPDVVTTPILLEHLDDVGVKATFFVVGKRIARSWRAREVLEETHRRGHTIGNHSYSHPVFPRISPDDQVQEILKTQALVRRATGVKTRLFRPPYGALTRYIRGWLAKKGYTIVMWNLDSNDPFDHSAFAVFDYVMRFLTIKKGGILLFHDTHIWSVSATPEIIREVRRMDCELISRGESPIYFTGLDRFGIRNGGFRARPTPDEVEAMERQYARIKEFCTRLDREEAR